jgi:hypothetical protein
MYTPQTLKYLSTSALNEIKNQIVNFDLPFHRHGSMEFYIGTGNEGKAEFQNTQNPLPNKLLQTF